MASVVPRVIAGGVGRGRGTLFGPLVVDAFHLLTILIAAADIEVNLGLSVLGGRTFVTLLVWLGVSPSQVRPFLLGRLMGVAGSGGIACRSMTKPGQGAARMVLLEGSMRMGARQSERGVCALHGGTYARTGGDDRRGRAGALGAVVMSGFGGGGSGPFVLESRSRGDLDLAKAAMERRVAANAAMAHNVLMRLMRCRTMATCVRLGRGVRDGGRIGRVPVNQARPS